MDQASANRTASIIMMEMIIDNTREGLSANRLQEFRTVWAMLSDYGKEWFEIWAEENDYKLPKVA